ncbi:MAG: hypothetical protein LBT21_04555 [Oscillospiraceae bacterium]|jgi:hypothetical protein|nr:hypothetical protein [Oscillospiraceae bacterium]
MWKTKLRRTLSAVLAAVMLLLMLPLTSMAADSGNTWEKTYPYKIPVVGKYLAVPGQFLIKSFVLPKLLEGMDGTIKGVTDGIYTNELVNTLMLSQNGIEFDATVVVMGRPITTHTRLRPNGVSDSISAVGAKPDHAKYDSVKKKINTVNLSGTITAAKVAEEWQKLETLADNGELDWGVTDRASFIEAAGIATRPLIRLLCYRSLGFLGEDGVYANDVAPGLEALGCKGVISAKELTAIYDEEIAAIGGVGDAYDMNAISVKMQCDFALAAILNPVLDLLEELQADLQGTIVRILPNLAYHRDDITRLIAAQVTPPGSEPMKIFEGIGGAFGLSLTGTIEEVMDSILANANLPVKLPALPWKELAGAGDLDKATDTVAADESLIYAVLVNFAAQTVDANESAVIGLLSDSLKLMPALGRVLFTLLKTVLWLANL